MEWVHLVVKICISVGPCIDKDSWKNIWLLKCDVSENNFYVEGRSLISSVNVQEETGLPELHAPFFSLVIRTWLHFQVLTRNLHARDRAKWETKFIPVINHYIKFVCNWARLLVHWCANLLKLYIYEN